jgi:hypothetical protein
VNSATDRGFLDPVVWMRDPPGTLGTEFGSNAYGLPDPRREESASLRVSLFEPLSERQTEIVVKVSEVFMLGSYKDNM